MGGYSALNSALRRLRSALDARDIPGVYSALGVCCTLMGPIYSTPPAVDLRGRPRIDPGEGEGYLSALGCYDLLATLPTSAGLGGVPFEADWPRELLRNLMSLLNRGAPVSPV